MLGNACLRVSTAMSRLETLVMKTKSSVRCFNVPIHCNSDAFTTEPAAVWRFSGIPSILTNPFLHHLNKTKEQKTPCEQRRGESLVCTALTMAPQSCDRQVRLGHGERVLVRSFRGPGSESLAQTRTGRGAERRGAGRERGARPPTAARRACGAKRRWAGPRGRTEKAIPLSYRRY